MTKPRDAREDLIGRLGPLEGPRLVVVDLHVAINGRLEVARASMDAAAQLLIREQPEPAFDEVDPRRPLRREVQMIPRALREPALDHGRLVRGVVVQGDVDVEIRRNGGVEGVEEFLEIDPPGPRQQTPEHPARLPGQPGRRATSCRGARNHGFAAPPGPAAWATAAGSDPAPESAPSRPRTAPGPCPADSDRARRCRAPSR